MEPIFTRVELSGTQAGVIARVQQARIRAVMERSNEIARRNMREALEQVGRETVTAWVAEAPVGRGNPGTIEFGGHTPPRTPGTYKRSIRSRVTEIHNDAVLEVYSTDPVSEYLEHGTGRYREGVGGRRLIRPRRPGGRMVISDEQADVNVVFAKTVVGQRARHFARRAQMTVRPRLGATLKYYAKKAKEEMVAALKAT